MTWKCKECGNINPDLYASCVKCSIRRENFDIDIQNRTSQEETKEDGNE